MTCLMRTTGEQLDCKGEGKVTYPLLDRVNIRRVIP